MDISRHNNIKVVRTLVCGSMLGIIAGCTFAAPTHKTQQDCTQNNLQNVLPCFISKESSTPVSWHLSDVKQDQEHDLTIYTYELTSQHWPAIDLTHAGRDWKHTLMLYVPNTIKSPQAMLYINGGTRNAEDQTYLPAPEKVDFKGMAAETQTVVADLQDIPNQYLRLDDGVARREDGIMAYGWNKFMDNPQQNAGWVGHLAMAKAVVKAMDVIQAESKAQSFSTPEQFILVGASKRGWTAWLTTLADERVNGVVPIVIDILNTRKNLEHIYNSLEDWPLAFKDYVQQGVTDRIKSEEFGLLMQIEDPMTYLPYKQYQQRLSVPKYIINASSDDFFVPDSLNQYIEELPGENTIRILPNQRHYVNFKVVGKALKEYYNMFVDSVEPPKVTWNASKDHQSVEITTYFKPQQVTLWMGHNPEKRDFRVTSGVKYEAQTLKGDCFKGRCVYQLPKDQHATGFTSRFVEFTYKTGNYQLTTTSPAFITPNIYLDKRH